MFQYKDMLREQELIFGSAVARPQQGDAIVTMASPNSYRVRKEGEGDILAYLSVQVNVFLRTVQANGRINANEYLTEALCGLQRKNSIRMPLERKEGR